MDRLFDRTSLSKDYFQILHSEVAALAKQSRSKSSSRFAKVPSTNINLLGEGETNIIDIKSAEIEGLLSVESSGGGDACNVENLATCEGPKDSNKRPRQSSARAISDPSSGSNKRKSKGGKDKDKDKDLTVADVDQVADSAEIPTTDLIETVHDTSKELQPKPRSKSKQKADMIVKGSAGLVFEDIQPMIKPVDVVAVKEESSIESFVSEFFLSASTRGLVLSELLLNKSVVELVPVSLLQFAELWHRILRLFHLRLVEANAWLAQYHAVKARSVSSTASSTTLQSSTLAATSAATAIAAVIPLHGKSSQTEVQALLHWALRRRISSRYL